MKEEKGRLGIPQRVISFRKFLLRFLEFCNLRISWMMLTIRKYDVLEEEATAERKYLNVSVRVNGI